MDNFASTKGRHEFLYGTMPRIASNLDSLTKAVNALSEKIGPTPVITEEKIRQISDAYKSNCEVILELDKMYDDGSPDEALYEKGYSAAIEFVCGVLGIDLGGNNNG